MPVVSVEAAPHPQIGTLLTAVTDAIAGALGLGDGDVIVTHVPTGASATSGSGVVRDASAWPVVSIHGSDRGRERMDAARAAAEHAVRQWCARNRVECEGVWTEWRTP